MAVVLVTGSNSGFGTAIALAFAARGDTVVAGMRDPGRAGALLAAAADAGVPPPDVVALDVTDPSSRQHAVDAAAERHGAVDVLVNNAGTLHVASLEDTPSDVFESVMHTNVLGPIELTKLVLPGMRARGRGRIVAVTAIGAVLCTPFLAAYVASKHAMDAAIAALDLEVRPFGIRAVSVLPGSFRTGILVKSTPGRDGEAYAVAGGAFRDGFTARIEQASSDLTPVADAVVRATTDADPVPRRVVVHGPLGDALQPVVDELDRLHVAEAQRLGLT